MLPLQASSIESIYGGSHRRSTTLSVLFFSANCIREWKENACSVENKRSRRSLRALCALQPLLEFSRDRFPSYAYKGACLLILRLHNQSKLDLICYGAFRSRSSVIIKFPPLAAWSACKPKLLVSSWQLWVWKIAWSALKLHQSLISLQAHRDKSWKRSLLICKLDTYPLRICFVPPERWGVGGGGTPI